MISAILAEKIEDKVYVNQNDAASNLQLLIKQLLISFVFFRHELLIII